VVCPGSMETALTQKIAEEKLAPYRSANLLKRFEDLDEIARVVLLAAREDASFITGSVNVADGGYTTV
jgi:NAD(P)-dependent dehydrogenase (short-subunit alcohol dehydrogenase family)